MPNMSKYTLRIEDENLSKLHLIHCNRWPTSWSALFVMFTITNHIRSFICEMVFIVPLIRSKKLFLIHSFPSNRRTTFYMIRFHWFKSGWLILKLRYLYRELSRVTVLFIIRCCRKDIRMYIFFLTRDNIVSENLGKTKNARFMVLRTFYLWKWRCSSVHFIIWGKGRKILFFTCKRPAKQRNNLSWMGS